MSISRFNLDDLQVFILAYELRSLSKTAETLYTSRQSVSRSLDRMENLFQFRLFERDAKGITPTAFADILFPKAKQLVAEASGILELRDSYVTERPFSIGVIGHYNTGDRLEQLIGDYCADSGAQISIVHHEWPEIVNHVSSHELDFAYIALVPEFIPQNLDSYQITQDEFFLVAAPGSPYASFNAIPAEELNGKQLLLLSRYDIQRGILKPYVEQNHLSPKIFLTTSDVFILDRYVGKPEYMVLVLRYVAEQLLKLHPDYVKIPLNPPAYRYSGMIYRHSMPLSKQQRSALAYLRNNLESCL